MNTETKGSVQSGSLNTLVSSPSFASWSAIDEFEQQGYPDLTNQVELAEGRFPAHSGGHSDIYIGYMLADPSLEVHPLLLGGQNRQKVAIKVPRVRQEEIETIRKHLNREAAIWCKLKHKNILSFLGIANVFGRFQRCPALITPYCHNGTARDYVLKWNPPVEDRLQLILGVARGLEYLHEEGIIHGNLNPYQVLLSDRDEPLLCGFGWSSISEMRGFTTRPAGIVRYQAPELLEGTTGPNRSTDIYALGLTAFEIWTGVKPFNEILNDNALFMHILIRNAQPQLPSYPPPMADRIWPILCSCFSHAPENRPMIQEVIRQLESCIQVPLPEAVENCAEVNDLAMEVAMSVAQQKLPLQLESMDTQPLVDFFSKELLDNRNTGISPIQRRSILKFLSKLVKSARVFPKFLELESVQCDLISPVTQGGFGFIYKGAYEGRAVCVKVIRVLEQHKHYKEQLRAQAGELTIWAHLTHKNILPFLGLYVSDETVRRICAVSPWMENGDLVQYLRYHPHAPRVPLLHDTIAGLQYLHELDIVHADLKATNVLVSERGRAIIADFGLSRVSMTNTTGGLGAGTVNWMAPELLLDDNPIPKKQSDIWAFGCTCYEALSGRTPFDQFNTQKLILAFIKGNVTPQWSDAELDSRPDEKEKIRPLVEQCWDYDPECRPTSDTLLDTFSKLNIHDDRPPDEEARPRRDVEVDIDYSRMYGILQRIRENGMQNREKEGARSE